MTLLQYILWLAIGVGIVVIVFMTFDGIFAQTPPAKAGTPPATTVPPPVQLPVPVPQPTPTSPAPNLQYLPQKAYVQAYAPENGIPASNQPLQVVPQTVPAPVAPASTPLGIPNDILSYIAMGSAGLAYFKTHILGKKTDKVEEVTREQSAQIVKGAEVDRSIADQVYENMTDKGVSIKDKPEIKLETLAANKEEAVKTATKA